MIVKDAYGTIAEKKQTAGDWIKKSRMARKELSSSLQERQKEVETLLIS